MPQPPVQAPLTFQQIHIDAARNATDDFNLFHDPRKWDRIRNNPFGGPIALGFQLEALIEDHLRRHREANRERELIVDNGLRFSNYQITFASVAKPGEHVEVEIKKSLFKEGDNPALGNRIAIKGERGIVLFGFKKETRSPLFLADTGLPPLPDLDQQSDRSYIAGSALFYKRKYMSNGNAKNFLSGSLADQSAYFDELEDRVSFPEIYPAALISCALLERARHNHHDFENEPMVYTGHDITIDRQLTQALRSNDVLHLLVDEPMQLTPEKEITQYRHHCFGIVQDGGILFRAEITMMPLAAILKATSVS